ncbi:hypothetical protein B0H14DRAFT_833510 [Mycena olivaceomarginata]|nr:hypothetical protein B0H14DRAFT_833510 [Mycena olivaceomarginata]
MPPPIVLSDDEDDAGSDTFGADDDTEKQLQPIDINASKTDIIKGYQSCQLDLGRVLAENRSLRQRVSELEATAASKRRRGTGMGDNRLGYQKNVGSWARYFLLTKEAWVKTEDFRKSPPELSLDPAARFGSNTAYSNGITAALFDMIPVKYHPLLDYAEYRHLGKDFIAEVGNARSSTINSLRGVIPSILTSAGHAVDGQLLSIAAADRSRSNVLLGLLRFPGETTSRIFAPILFPNGQKKMEFIFLSKIVLDIHRVMTFGPSSLGVKPDAKSNGIKYAVFEATDHSIALAGIFARFLVSADKTFANTGTITKITWEADYRTYRKLLATNRDTPFVRHIFKTVNDHVFAGVSKTAGNVQEDGGDPGVEDEISQAMHHLAFGDFEDPTHSDEDAVDYASDQPPVAGPSHRRARISDEPPQIRVIPNREEEQEVAMQTRGRRSKKTT